MDDKVSIIIPFYNGGLYLKDCIENISRQTYKNIEVIFIDDGSNDNSIHIFNKYRRNNMILISQKKSGVSAARNKGIEISTGKYISFIDVDDFVENNFIEKFVDSITKSKADVVICYYTEEYSSSKKIITLPWSNKIIGKATIENELIPRMIYPLQNEDPIAGMVWRTFTTKKFIQKNNITFNERVAIAEDLLFTIQLYNKAKSIYILSEPLYHYNRNSNSSLNQYKPNSLKKQKEYHNILIKLLKSENLYEKNKIRYEKNKLRLYTGLISNATKNPIKENGLKEIKEVYYMFKDEKIDYKKHNFNILINITYFLLNHKFLNVLYLLYSIKEKNRLKKLN